MRCLALSVLLATGLGSCGDPTSGSSTGVVVAVEGQAFRISNKTSQPLAYAVFDAEILALINWARCADPTPECLRLPARGSVLVPFEAISGYDGNGGVVVYVWKVVRKSSLTYEAVDVATIGITP